MTAPQPLRPSVVAMLDTAARSALAHAIGRDAAAHYDRARAGQSGPYDADAAAASVAGPCMWPYQARFSDVCPEAADPDDTAGYCTHHAEIDGSGR